MPKIEDDAGLRVIGVGLQRTGTFSLSLALEELGFAPCYHARGLYEHIPGDDRGWLDAAPGDRVDWRRVFAGYAAAVDHPVFVFWRDLVALYPEAKVILTVRDADAWYESFMSTIYPAVVGAMQSDDLRARRVMGAVRQHVLVGMFGDRFEDADFAKDVYRRYNDEIRSGIPSERLLEFDQSEGWDPLCAFLGCETPPTPYPRANDRERYWRRFYGDDPSAPLTSPA